MILGAIVVFVGVFVVTGVMVIRMRQRERARSSPRCGWITPRYGITVEQGMVFTDWQGLLRTRRSLPP